MIGEKGVVQIAELAEICGVSLATIRRDLNELDHDGAIRRTHGGAVLRDTGPQEQPHRKKLQMMRAEKTRIALAAAHMISDGESIFLDSGTTTMLIAKRLEHFKNLTVITNNTDIIQTIQLHTSSQLIIVGGICRQDFSVLVGPTAEDFIRNLKISKVFIGADAVDAHAGLYSSNILEVTLKQLSIRSGQTKVLVTDSTKFQIDGLMKVCGLEEFDYIITDNGLDAETTAWLCEQPKPHMVFV